MVLIAATLEPGLAVGDGKGHVAGLRFHSEFHQVGVGSVVVDDPFHLHFEHLVICLHPAFRGPAKLSTG